MIVPLAWGTGPNDPKFIDAGLARCAVLHHEHEHRGDNRLTERHPDQGATGAGERATQCAAFRRRGHKGVHGRVAGWQRDGRPHLDRVVASVPISASPGNADAIDELFGVE